jgi:predicted amidophosphoribosyltransferase
MNQVTKNGCSYHYLYEYLPSRFEATDEQKKVRTLVWKFRDGDYQTIYHLILNGIEDIIRGDKAQWTICCIPAHSIIKTQKRFETFLKQLSNELDVTNGYSVVSIKEDFVGSVFKTEPRSILPNLGFNNNGILGKRIILIDDVIKSGRTFYEVADKLDSLGASKVIGFFIGLSINPDQHQ